MRQLVCLLVLATAGCEKHEPLACYVPDIASPEPKNWAQAKPAEWGAHINSCVHHWSRALAGSPDSPYAVVDAVMHICGGQDFAMEADALNHDLPRVYPDVDATEKDLRDDARGEALAEVEAFREAKCKGPDDPHLG